MPAASRRIMPARSISWWLTISASAGASLSVEMKNCEARIGAHGLFCRWAVEKSSRNSSLRRACGARQGRLPSERRHHPRQREERGVLGQAGPPARLAVSAGRHPAGERPSRRCTASWRRKSGCSASTCGSWAARATGCATRCREHWVASATGAAAYRGQKQIWYLLRLVGRDCDVKLRASEQARVRRLALARLLGAARQR